jgi:hypothetical protein
MGNAVHANPRPNRGVNVADAEPVVFTERGVEFFVFADGQFDFNTRPAVGTSYLYRSGQRHANATFGAPGIQNENYGVVVEHDNFGRVRRVGNVFINYDAYDRIKRIGSVYMTYNRFALAQVGGLQLIYNNRGQIVGTRGSVNGRRPAVIVQNHYNSYNNNYSNGYTAADESDYYYYKPDGTKAAVKE